jgi:membrane protease YdiL (CAAX protease family)
LSRLDRGLAVILSLVWLLGGAFGLYLGVTRSRWGLAALSLAALCYGLAWLRVALRSRLLTWRELVVPWRRGPARPETGDPLSAPSRSSRERP